MFFINVGLGSSISAKRISSVLSPNSAQIKRYMKMLREGGRLRDFTNGRKNLCVNSYG